MPALISGQVLPVRDSRTFSRPIRLLTTDRPKPLELHEPRSVVQIVGTALDVFARYPAMFLLLALAVIVPYELAVLAVTGEAPLSRQKLSPQTVVILFLLDVALIGPLISALYIQAVVTIGDGEKPKLVSVVSRGLRVLPVVAAAQIIAGLGIGVGTLALIIPGLILLIRWAVVAQIAAIERTDWMGALRRSGELTRGNYLHVFAVVAITTGVNVALSAAATAVSGSSSHASEVVLGIAVVTLTRSFAALIMAVLFFDLVARKIKR